MKKVSNQLKSFHTSGFLGGLIVVVGVILRLQQYFVNRSLWVDEASLALNIINRTFGALTLPLDYDQGAPIGFLLIEKFIVLNLGDHDYILRLFPLLSGVLATYLIYHIANEHFGKFGMIAALLFSISGSMVYYSSELKQYSSDVMIALLLTYLSLLCIRQESHARNIILLGLAGIFSIWVSHPSAFILPGIGLMLVVEKMLKKTYSQIRWLFGIGIMWGGAFLMTYMLSLRYLIDNKFLQDYWHNNYAPLPPWEHLDWYKDVLISLLPHVSPSFLPNVIQNFHQKYLIEGCLILILVGAVSLFLRNEKLAFLIISPFLMTFIASAMHRYPMSDRFLFFWFPFLLLLMAEGLGQIYSICSKFNSKAALLVYGLVALIILWTPFTSAFYNALYPPIGEDIKPVLAYVRDHMQKDDIIYVHNGSVTPFMYYAPFYGLNVSETFVAKKSWNVKRFTIDVEDFRGSNRIWFIFSHVISCDCNGGSREDRVQAHVQILDEYGVQLDRFEASKAVVYLYNLSRR